MGMNDTPSGERIHIGFFGRRNAGKSSVVNAVTGQNLSIVSATKGTIGGAFTLMDANPLLSTSTVKRSVRFLGLIIRDATGPHGRGYFLLPKLPAVIGETPTNTLIQSGQLSFDVP